MAKVKDSHTNTATGTEEKKPSLIANGAAAFTVERDSLLNALVLCAKIVARTSAIPLLQCIKFDLKGDTLFVTAMDLPKQAVLQMLKVTNEAGEDGSYCLNAKEVIELVKRMPDGNLVLRSKIRRLRSTTVTAAGPILRRSVRINIRNCLNRLARIFFRARLKCFVRVLMHRALRVRMRACQ